MMILVRLNLVALGSVQSRVVVPIHVFRSGDVDFLNSMPRAARFNQLGLARAYHGLRQCVVECVADGADRGIDAGFERVWGEPERRVLTAGVGMVREFVFLLFPVVL
jgi:hypothetical protein